MMRSKLPGKYGMLVVAALAAGWLAGCQKGSKGSTGETGPTGDAAPIPTTLDRTQDLPGTAIAITGLAGATGTEGRFQPGDTIRVTFTVKNDAGEALPLSELDSGSIMVSGPTFNYQRVIASASDLRAASTQNADGSYTYAFATPIPATYIAPLNDTASLTDGEMTGQALLAGTYTVGIEAYKTFTIEGASYRDAANAVQNFLIGDATAIEPREVVKRENCNRCHDSVRAHGEFRRDTTLCLLCHTSGAEDKNTATAAGGTPGVTIDSRVMFHKIHNGRSLPSVLGVTTNDDGSRNYDATPVPYEIVGHRDSVNDFSDIVFPVWPSLDRAMPQNVGFSNLTGATNQAGTQVWKDDRIRKGVIACAKCHGDPDGSGPLAAPAQGGLAYTQPTRRACGSCHDDVDWTKPYTKNSQTMPPQADDSSCAESHCHSPGDPLAADVVHIHPMLDPNVNSGFNVVISSVEEAGTNDGDGTIDPGEKVKVTFTIKDDAGNDIPASQVATLAVMGVGPLFNKQQLVSTSLVSSSLSPSTFPAATSPVMTQTVNLLTGMTSPYALTLPRNIVLEYAGDAAGGAGETISLANAPVWDPSITGAMSVWARTGTASATTLAGDMPAGRTYIEVASITGYKSNDYAVIDDGVGGKEEYVRVSGTPDGSRINISPALRYAHTSGATVKKATLTAKALTTDYTVDAAAGTLTTVTDFGAGNAVVVSYVIDFVMPAQYTAGLDDTEEIGEALGDWQGLDVLSGTYRIGFYGYKNLIVKNAEEKFITYRASTPADGSNKDFLVGSAEEIADEPVISSNANCDSCHDMVIFHGAGRRGLDNCLLCHGQPGAGPEIAFRTLLHEVHKAGEDLAESPFPAMPGGLKKCTMCHGAESTSWKEPADRTYPESSTAALVWQPVCTGCHDEPDAEAHIAIQTDESGVESCGVCHGPDAEFAVELMHKTW